MSDTYDYLIIGAGIVGLATALKLIEAEPSAKVAIVDKEASVAAHQTGHNSGVIHSGIYYRPGSLKATLCVAGAWEMMQFCVQNDIPTKQCGKIIVAVTEKDLPALEELYSRGNANGIPELERLDQEGLKRLEPEIRGVAALHLPMTSIVNYKKVAVTFARLIQDLGGRLFLGSEVTHISEQADTISVQAGSNTLRCRFLIGCAGLFSDRLARLAGCGDHLPHILPFRGEYYNLAPEWAQKVHRLIYPVPDSRFPFLGVHLSPKMDGSIEAGPNAVLATAREGYTKSDFDVADCWHYLRYPGFWRMVGKYWKTGLAEAYRSINKGAFCRELQGLVPGVQANDLKPGGSGVRAQLVMHDGKLQDDFVIAQSKRMIHVLNAPSPAATASLAIGAHITKLVQEASKSTNGSITEHASSCS